MLAKKIAACVSLAFLINVASFAPTKEEEKLSALAQSELTDISQSDLQSKLYELDNLRVSAINSESYQTLYDIGLEYVILAEMAKELDFFSINSTALYGAEIALTTVLNNTGIFAFVRQNIPARSETYSSEGEFSFSFGWSWSSGQSETSCSVNYFRGQNSAALESSTSRLLQRVFIEQGKYEAAMLTAEVSRSIAVDKSVFLNALDRRDRTFDLCDLAEDFAPRLTVADMQELAVSQNATIVSYSINSYRDDPHFIKYIRNFNRGIKKPFGIIVWPSEIYIWVIKPDGEIFFEKQPLSVLNLNSLGIGCDPLRDCQGFEYDGILAGVSGSRGDAEVSRGFVIDDPHAQKPELDRNVYLNELYELLIKPIKYSLPASPNSRVVFVPQGPLSFVPFAALRDSTDPSGKYFIEEHTIITVPNFRHLRLSQERRNELGDNSRDALIVGNPTLNLPFSGAEAQEVAEMLRAKGFNINGRLFLGADANKRNVVNRMKNSRIIHLASHGNISIDSPDLPDLNALIDVESVHSMDPMDAFELYAREIRETLASSSCTDVGNSSTPLGILYSLYCSPTAGGSILLARSSGSEDDDLTAVDILDLDLSSTELVVLSACDTGLGPLTPGGIVGLPFSLSIAGVPSVIVSLWAVEDESTKELMVAFYQHLLDNPTQNPLQDKAIALRLAMLDRLKEDPDASHEEWAAFTLVGSAD